MSQPTFEYCAFRFLTQWQEDEANIYREISRKPTPDSIRQALAYFQVSRTFKNIKENGNAQFVADALISVRADTSLSEGHEKVHGLASALEDRFNRYNLSAASKLLWLSQRDPYVILDSRAVKALTAISGGFADRDYGAYAKVWREQYEKRQAKIKAAAAKLSKARMFIYPELPPDDELLAMTSETWFLERVFDIYLWVHNGATTR